MAEVLPPRAKDGQPQAAPPPPNPEGNKPTLPPVTIPQPLSKSRSGHLNLDVFSPVNQNGSFEFDRVLKSGDVHLRSRKTKQWKRYFLVLRPNLLSMYKNSSEAKLLKQITLSELTAVAYLKDPKRKRDHTFGIYSPSKNYHFQGKDERDVREWIALIKTEARIDEEEEEDESMIPNSLPVDSVVDEQDTPRAFEERPGPDRLASSSPELTDESVSYATPGGMEGLPWRKGSMQEFEYSGNEGASYSDFSDAGPSWSHASSARPGPSSQPAPKLVLRTATRENKAAESANANLSQQPELIHADTQLDGATADIDKERVIWHGYLLLLKAKGGMRQWKKLWVVIRPKNLAFYKNEEEYSAHLLIPMANIISADEIDPISRSKTHCLQIIVEEKNYKFAAFSEEGLTRCLGALKSQFAKRKEKEAVLRQAP